MSYMPKNRPHYRMLTSIKTANIKLLLRRLILTIAIPGIKNKAPQAAYFAPNYVEFYNAPLDFSRGLQPPSDQDMRLDHWLASCADKLLLIT